MSQGCCFKVFGQPPPLGFWGSGKSPCCSPFHSYSLLMRKRRYPVVSIHRHFPFPGEVRAACAQLPMAAHQGPLHRRRRWNQRSMVENGGRIHRRQCLFLPPWPRFRPHFPRHHPRNYSPLKMRIPHQQCQNHTRNHRFWSKIARFPLANPHFLSLHPPFNASLAYIIGFTAVPFRNHRCQKGSDIALRHSFLLGQFC